MDIARIQVKLPEGIWHAQVNREYPDLHLEVISYHILEDASVLHMVRLEGPQAAEAMRFPRSHPMSTDFHVLHQVPTEVIFSLRTRGIPMVRAFQKSEVILQTPLIFRRGYGTYTVLGSRQRIHALLRTFDEMEISYRLESIRSAQERRSKGLLTPHQERVIRYALRRGYYDVPRRADLEDLSGRLGLSRSGLSELLRRGERRLIQDHCESHAPGLEVTGSKGRGRPAPGRRWRTREHPG
ncbi:MAG: helix-turn-helix domain-containing protein [Euryarchaeota archaeon]|nr:helix-turn-helix domain-containing protein [Euryarchaeota archaeon]